MRRFSGIHTVHFYGDSLTAGYGAAPADGWIARLARRFPRLTLYNHGECGRLFSDIAADAWTVVHYPAEWEALFLMGGTNDILCGIRFAALLRKAEEEIRGLSARIPLILGTPLLTTRASIAAGWQQDWQYEENDRELAAAIFSAPSRRSSPCRFWISRKSSPGLTNGIPTASIRTAADTPAWRRRRNSFSRPCDHAKSPA